MTWTKLDENFDQHPKIVAAGPLAELMHIHALIYCNRYLTDGFIPDAVIPRLLPTPPFRAAHAKLVELGMWEPVKGGYQIHDFLEYQPSRSKVLANRQQKASNGSSGGLAKAQANRLAKSYPVSVPVSVAVTEGSLEPTIPLLHSGLAEPSYGIPETSMHESGSRHIHEILGAMRIQPVGRKEAI